MHKNYASFFGKQENRAYRGVNHACFFRVVFKGEKSSIEPDKNEIGGPGNPYMKEG
jgi:hypothetical protein